MSNRSEFKLLCVVGLLIPIAIRAVGYDGHTLAVLFHTNDTIYEHPRVPYSVYAGQMRASSKGASYNIFIRGKFK